MKKKLVRSKTNKMFAGVLGGISEYFQIDATIIRLLFVITIPFTAGFMFFFYLAAIFIIPRRGDVL
ncbi:PspC domain-containing protein [Aquibacillus kalidii]|uniref:PspC domain-containing protein n=1 Tax=Aquibacillus kalidii TaxID=2762597 RepID=UPI0016487165|nr:PspC domain-containing protein [Aquibacillus kalidii]